MLTALLLAAACPSAAFVTLEGGRIANVTWTERTESAVKSHAVLNHTLIMDADVELRPDGTAVRATSQRGNSGEKPDDPVTRELGENVTFWSDSLASSLEQAILRAKATNAAVTRMQGASLWNERRTPIEVQKMDATDWVVEVNKRHYDVLTDEQGCLISATLPAYGVLVERRELKRDAYPLWTQYGPPPDHAYEATDVSIKAPQGHVLAGTLTTPKHKGPFAAVVFITGISPHERNHGRPPFVPFRDLSDALARAGIAALRVDDRGVGKSTGDRKTATTFDEADDVQTEVAWLRARKEIDPRKIFLVGYSEGGTIAPIVASRDAKLAGIVTLAGSGVPALELARYQTEIAVMADPDVPPFAKHVEIEKQMNDELSPREKAFMGIDPLAFAKQVKCPALIVQGGSDLHVPVRSAERLAHAMRAAGNKDVTVRIFPGVSHLIAPDPVGLADYWITVPAHLVPQDMLDAVVSFVAERR